MGQDDAPHLVVLNARGRELSFMRVGCVDERNGVAITKSVYNLFRARPVNHGHKRPNLGGYGNRVRLVS